MTYIPSGTELLNPYQILEHCNIREGMQVVDLGCGSIGHFVFPAARMVGKSGMVYGIDILKSALSGIESRSKLEGVSNVRTVWSDIEIIGSINIPPGTIDLIVLVNNQPKTNMIAEGVRLLKPGGQMLIVDWKPSASPFGPPSKDRVEKEVVKTTAVGEKLHLKEEWEAGQYHYGLVFVK